jgi:linoleoyl-CoA desaturase
MKLKFSSNASSTFYADVKNEVDNYFKEKNISKNANGLMVFKAVLFMSIYGGLYTAILFAPFSLPVKLGLSVLLGINQAMIGFNICHDAIHGSFSSNRHVNNALSWLFNLVGASPYMWKTTHNKVHHTFTNIPGHDEDIEIAPGLVRVSRLEPLKPIMKYQKYYAFILYGFASLSWVLRKDFVKFFQEKIGETDNTNHPKIEYFNLFFYKAMYYVIFLVIPYIVMDITILQLILGFFVMHFAEGVVLGLTFQLAHVVEGTDFPEPDDLGNIQETWAAHQMQTTANFARNSWLTTFVCGGLNYQIEHHLFTQICHVHYPKISNIVRDVALRHNLPYHESPSFGKALVSHYRVLEKLGQEERMLQAS